MPTLSYITSKEHDTQVLTDDQSTQEISTWSLREELQVETQWWLEECGSKEVESERDEMYGFHRQGVNCYKHKFQTN